MSTYYSKLGVDPTADQAEITTAYERQRQRYDPALLTGLDESLRTIAHERSSELEHIYAVLTDPARRQQYDSSIGLAQPDAPTAVQSALPAARERWYALGGVLLAVLLIGTIWVLTDRTEQPSVGEVNRPVPALSLTTLAGDELDFAALKGQVVLVNFWATWCEPCKRETPALQAAFSDLEDQGLMIVGVNLTDDELAQGNTRQDIRAFVDQYAVTYPIALDIAGEATRAFRVFPLPTSFFIDREGTIRYVRVGEITAEEVAALFATLNQGPTARDQETHSSYGTAANDFSR